MIFLSFLFFSPWNQFVFYKNDEIFVYLLISVSEKFFVLLSKIMKYFYILLIKQKKSISSQIFIDEISNFSIFEDIFEFYVFT